MAGFAYVMPIGAQNIFLIHSSMKLGAPKNLLVASYVFLADLSLAFICFFGVGQILTSSFILRIILSLLGSLVLFMMGYKLITSSQVTEVGEEQKIGTGYLKKAVLVTYANPQAIIDGALIYGALRATYSSGSLASFFMGNVTASILWFGGLSTTVAVFKNTKVLSNLKWVERVCGVLMLLMGAKVIWVVFRSVYDLN